jgi:precorrin-2 dehydrogenase/sirohydrochlorin ferrochelatase
LQEPQPKRKNFRLIYAVKVEKTYFLPVIVVLGKIIFLSCMIPIALDPRYSRLALAGNGKLALRRLAALRAAGAGNLRVFADAPEPALVEAAGRNLHRRLPEVADLALLHALWIADLPDAAGALLAQAARDAGVLVNSEDRPEFCDFHSVAEVRRKDLLLTVSTNGKAPGLAGVIRQNLEGCFGPEWDERVDEVARLRAGWRAEGVGMAETASRIAALAADRCWLFCRGSQSQGAP